MGPSGRIGFSADSCGASSLQQVSIFVTAGYGYDRAQMNLLLGCMASTNLVAESSAPRVGESRTAPPELFASLRSCLSLADLPATICICSSVQPIRTALLSASQSSSFFFDPPEADEFFLAVPANDVEYCLMRLSINCRLHSKSACSQRIFLLHLSVAHLVNECSSLVWRQYPFHVDHLDSRSRHTRACRDTLAYLPKIRFSARLRKNLQSNRYTQRHDAEVFPRPERRISTDVVRCAGSTTSLEVTCLATEHQI